MLKSTIKGQINSDHMPSAAYFHSAKANIISFAGCPEPLNSFQKINKSYNPPTGSSKPKSKM